jgi:hypothetical protein
VTRLVWLVAVTEMTTELIVSLYVPLAPAKRPVPPVIVSASVLWAVVRVNVPDPVMAENSLSPFAATKVLVPSGLFDLLHFQFIHTVIGADRIIWSVDYPYLTLDGAREFLGKLPVSEQDREKIAHLNAEKLFTL